MLENFQWLSLEEVKRSGKDPKKLKEIECELVDAVICCLSMYLSRAVIEKIKENERKHPVEKVKGYKDNKSERGTDNV